MKITIVGAGHVGATTAKLIADKTLCDKLVLLDILEGVPQGKVLDILQSCPIEYSDIKIVGTNDYDLTVNSDIIVIAAGVARRPGITRDDLLDTNAEIVKNCTELVTKKSQKAIIIVVSNPLDVMTYIACEISGFPKYRVMGMAGSLDAARFKTFVANELNVSVEDITCLVIGGHGDYMVPLSKYSTVSGIPLTELISKDKFDKIIERTKNAGVEIVNNLKTGTSCYAPASGVVQLVEAIVKDRKRIISCSTYLDGEFGLDDVCCGVPVKLGRNGIEEIIRMKLNDEEYTAFKNSAEKVKSNIAKLNI
jgi:malate dehydrogenase